MSQRGIACLSLFFSSWLVLSGASLQNVAECTEQTCLLGAPNPAPGDQLLQVGQTNARKLEVSVECSDAKLGKTIPLNAEGFRDVSGTCCYDDMRVFIRRVAEKAKLQVCHDGGLSGFAPFFSCTNETSFEQLKSEMMMQAEGKSPCRWLGVSGEECAPLDPACGVDTNPEKRDSVLQGYLGLEAEQNPPVLVTNPAIKEQIIKDIASKLWVPESSVKVEVGTGPVGSASFYQVAIKSNRTGKYVETGPDGDLVASSPSFKTITIMHQSGNDFLVKGGLMDLRVKWNKDEFSFQTESGEHAVEDVDGRLSFEKNPKHRLHVHFPGSSSLGQAPLDKHSRSLVSVVSGRSCTVMVSFEVLQTAPPSLDKAEVKKNAGDINVATLQSELTKDLDEIESCLGLLEISTFKFCEEKGKCEDKSLMPGHSDRKWDHEGNAIPVNDINPKEHDVDKLE